MEYFVCAQVWAGVEYMGKIKKILQSDVIAFPLQLLVFSFGMGSLEASRPTYQHRDPVSSVVYQCEQCPPGTAVLQHCNADVPTACAPCPEGHFSEHWHWGKACQRCTAVCKEQQLVQRDCTLTHNRLCACAPGYHLEVEFCVKHTVCSPGSGASVLGLYL